MHRLAAIALVLLCGGPAAAEHGLGARRQWQPQLAEAGLDPDHRLEQRVEAEIVGRAVVPALEMLSQATGVSLSVAPENLDTVGERKLTVISKGLTLKTIMVQIPEALQECHWDIDASGESPIYLLHRNAGAGQVLERQRVSRRESATQTMQELRAACLDDVRRVLAMSPEELAELERTDLFLARAARHPDLRALMQSIFALPEERMAELADTGYTKLAYADAPPQIQQAARLVSDLYRRWIEWVRSWPPEAERPPYWDEIDWDAQLADVAGKIESGEDLTVEYMALGGREVGYGVMMLLGDEGVSMTVVPARYGFPGSPYPGNYYHFLLTQTGDDDEAAIVTIERLSKQWLALRDERQWSESEWVEPSDPRLQQVVPIPFVSAERGEYTVLADLQQLIAERTGLSIISDYFTWGRVSTHPGQRPLGGPLWRDLYVLGQAARFEWKLVGDCLVFHREDWYRLAQWELPESFVERWRAKLEDQERFTLDDIVQFAVELEHRPQPRLRGVGRFAIPRDLLDAGADAASGPFRGMLLLYHALTPDERAAARSPNGLSLSRLPPAKRERVTEHVFPPGMQSAMLETGVAEFVSAMVLFVRESSGEERGRSFARYEFRLQHPDEPGISGDDWTLTVHLPEQPSE